MPSIDKIQFLKQSPIFASLNEDELAELASLAIERSFRPGEFVFWDGDSKFADGRLKLAVKHVPGRKAGQIMLYALSTCVWCKKTKQLLDELGVEYDYEYVDLLSGEERTSALKTVEKWNQKSSFPTLIMNDKCIVGFKENEIRDALKL